MSMSLEDLLAKEGFKRRKAKIMARTSFAAEGRSNYRGRDNPGSSSSIAVRRTQRTRSDIPRYDSNSEFSIANSFRDGKPRDNLMRKEKIDWKLEKESSVKNGRSRNRESLDLKRLSTGSSEELREPDRIEVAERDEIVEVGVNELYKDIYLNNVYGDEENEVMPSIRNEVEERHIQERGKNLMDNRYSNSVKYSPRVLLSSNGISRKSTRKSQSSDDRSNRNSESKHFVDESKGLRQTKIEEALAAPSLDEVAVKAIISILGVYVQNFVKDEDFRTSLRHNSFASLNFIGLEEGLNTESKILENLEQAIETVERAVEEQNANPKELKKASLQLSVITGLNSSDLKDGFTSGIPNFKLSACAHLYLSVLYMIQNKDTITAKHLLQVFCDSPFQARTTLLPDLWEHLFLPHLLQLKLWYDNEARSLSDSPMKANLKLLEKVYNESMDSGTYQFAKYYKDWLSEGVEAPPVPTIKIPSVSVQMMPKGGLYGHASSPASHASPQPMVSKKLYDEVFRRPQRDLEIYEEENFEIGARGSFSPVPEDKQLILYSHESETCINQNIEHIGQPLPDDQPVSRELQRFYPESSSGEIILDENSLDYHLHAENSRMPDMFQELPPAIENNLLHGIANTLVGEPQEIQESVAFSQFPEDATHRIVLEMELEPVQELQEDYESFYKKSSLFSISEDFLCPLTGLLFEDPVTLETGITFEREAMMNWFDKGYITCPVTRKTLQCRTLPDTNLVLKRVVRKWTEYCRHLPALVSQVAEASAESTKVNDNMLISILEQLLIVFSKDERTVNARRIISLGGLQYLLRRFHHANSREMASILPLLSCCVEADPSCKNDVARNINRLNLLELLHSEQLKIRTSAVLLLTELICLNRRTDAKSFLEGLQKEEIITAMDDLVVYLHSCPLEERPTVAVLILHLDLLSELETSNIHRQDAVDALTNSLERSLTDEKVQKKCSRALLVLGGCFSSSGKLMTEDWILKLSGFLNGPDWDATDHETHDIIIDLTESLTEDGEEKARDKWLESLSASLLGYGKKSFLETVSMCLTSGNPDLVRVCLTTVAWLSFSLSSLSETEFQLHAFSVLVSPLKHCLDYGELVEHKILASLCLLNFSEIPDCRVLLMKMAKQIGPSLENLAEVTWTAKELYTIISGQRR